MYKYKTLNESVVDYYSTLCNLYISDVINVANTNTNLSFEDRHELANQLECVFTGNISVIYNIKERNQIGTEKSEQTVLQMINQVEMLKKFISENDEKIPLTMVVLQEYFSFYGEVLNLFARESP
jgi:hypothetical protein